MELVLRPAEPHGAEDSSSVPLSLPIPAMIRAICRAAQSGPELLYEVMLKLALMVDSTAPTYGLSVWSRKPGERPALKWAEGLDHSELDDAEIAVAAVLEGGTDAMDIREGDRAMCVVLALPSAGRDGAAIYCRFARPLSREQAGDLRLLAEVARLALSHVASRPLLADLSAAPLAVPELDMLPGMIYRSRAMAAVATDVGRVKDSDSTVLITGESGTGKELIARALHRLSRRARAEFIPLNCTAAPSELVDSLLFGHKKGAFTGALSDYEGLVRAAEGGTLFLDEIGDLPLSVQPKLLRFLQEGEVHTLGERLPRKVNVRVVAATHKNLERCVSAGTFREDLYYRVATLTVHVPPLRERPEDTAALISHYVSYFARRNDRAIAGITADAVRVLQEYSWPGNVRELASEIERLVLYTEPGDYITPEQINQKILPEAMRQQRSASADSDLEHMMEDFERRVITETLRKNSCNVARTAEALGLGSRQTLYKKLKRLAIDVSEFLQDENNTLLDSDPKHGQRVA